MLEKLTSLIQKLVAQQVPATGLGIMRIAYGLVLLQEILFLLYFNHLIFDPIPFLDVEFPMISFFLGIWGIVAFFIVIGYRTQLATLLNYIFWIVFVSFTPMQRDFDGGFDPFMTGIAFFLIFLPVNRSFSIDNLRHKLKFSSLQNQYTPPGHTSILAYLVPVIICLGFLYFDSAIHKLFSEHWRNGLGPWLPSTQPYYISAIDMSWLLNFEYLQKTLGYSIIVFQFAFLALYLSDRFRPIALFFGLMLHLGITLTFNIYPFGLGMLALYPLLVPFRWWRNIAEKFKTRHSMLTVFYDEHCPLCRRTIITIQHFDLFSAIACKGLQSHAHNEPALKNLHEHELLTDLYAVDSKGHVYSGLDTYIQILIKSRYLCFFSSLIKHPRIYPIAQRLYRKIADNRNRTICDKHCAITSLVSTEGSVYANIFERYARQNAGTLTRRLAKIFVFIVILQLNSTIHYGFIYRFNLNPKSNPVSATLATISNSLLTLTTTFLGITPHALYLADHFKGYNHILGITYLDKNGNEKWLPFVNAQGRIIAPNWGRVHSMWANIAVTPNIDNHRLKKLLSKVTAFWGIKQGLNLDDTRFIIKLKKIQSPSQWIENLRYNNLAQPWKNIGYAQWSGKDITIILPDNIEAL